MNKREYLDRLTELLACLPPDQRIESVSFYAEMIDDRVEEGMTEEEAVAALDAPGVAAEAILDDLPAVPRAVAKTRRKSRVLLWAIVIIGWPVLLPIAVSFVLAAVLIYLAIWLCAVCVWVVAIGLLIGLPLGIVCAFWGVAAGNVPFAVVEFGAALLCGALGALCLRGAFVATRQFARLSRIWAAKALSPFVKVKRKDAGDGDANADGPRGGTPGRVSVASDAPASAEPSASASASAPDSPNTLMGEACSEVASAGSRLCRAAADHAGRMRVRMSAGLAERGRRARNAAARHGAAGCHRLAQTADRLSERLSATDGTR